MPAGGQGYDSSMGAASSLGLTRRTLHLIDGFVIIWIAACIALGVVVFREVHELTALSDTLVTAGRAIEDTTEALVPLEDLPFVGGEIRELIDRADETARNAQASGRLTREQIERSSLLLGLSVAIIPTVPLLAFYLPLRLSRAREVRAIRRALTGSDEEVALRAFLARRAQLNMPYHRLQRLTGDVWEEEQLAEAELRRLGIRRNRGGSTGPRTPRG
jgi:hypothetical protein